MSDPRPTNPYVAPSAATSPVATTGEAPVRIDARTQQAILSQAFLWMFVGLAVTALVAFVVQGNERLLQFAESNLFILIIAQFALVMAIGFGIRRMSATMALGAVLRLRRLAGIGHRPDRHGVHRGLGRVGLRLCVSDVRGRGDLRPCHEALARSASAACCTWRCSACSSRS